MNVKNNTINVEVTHQYSTTPEKVFEAWHDPKLAQKWFGPGLGQTRPVQIESKVGGKFRIVQIRDGEPVGHSGEYLVLDKPRYIAFTWATDDDEGSDEVHVYITPSDGGSYVRLVHTMDEEWKEFTDRTKASWLSMMKKMDELLADE